MIVANHHLYAVNSKNEPLNNYSFHAEQSNQGAPEPYLVNLNAIDISSINGELKMALMDWTDDKTSARYSLFFRQAPDGSIDVLWLINYHSNHAQFKDFESMCISSPNLREVLTKYFFNVLSQEDLIETQIQQIEAKRKWTPDFAKTFDRIVSDIRSENSKKRREAIAEMRQTGMVGVAYARKCIKLSELTIEQRNAVESFMALYAIH